MQCNCTVVTSLAINVSSLSTLFEGLPYFFLGALVLPFSFVRYISKVHMHLLSIFTFDMILNLFLVSCTGWLVCIAYSESSPCSPVHLGKGNPFKMWEHLQGRLSSIYITQQDHRW